MKRLLCCLLLLPALAAALPAHAPHPGGIAVLDLGPASGAAPVVRFAGQRVATVQHDGRWYVLAGIPLDQPLGEANLAIAGSSKPLAITVEPRSYREQHLTVKPSYVNPDEESLQRIVREREQLDAARTHFDDRPLADVALAAPIPGSRSDSFGSRRFFNNEPRSPHRGMDISGSSGTPVTAPLAGRVLVAGNFYFTGGTVMLDHGQGLITLYAHLSDWSVAEGDKVSKGQPFGLVGATGRVTGPHLHFATYLNGTPVDPGLLLPP